MNKVFAPYLRKFICIYLDDILIYSKTREDHLAHIRIVLRTLRQAKLYAKMSKCEFFKSEVKFLGHVVSREGISVDPTKVAVITSWPEPRNPGDVRSFLGLANYFRKYIRGYSATVAPMVKLTRANAQWEWGSEQ